MSEMDSNYEDLELSHEEDNDLEIDNLPNRLTIFRVVLIPIVLGALSLSQSSWGHISAYREDFGWAAGWLFALASITDFFDGYIARKRGIVTVFGSFLDPIADKFLVVSSLIMLGAMGRIPAIVVIILVLREMYMTSLRLLATNEGLKVPVNNMGKWKTATQMVAVPFLMVSQQWYFIDFGMWGQVFLYVSAALSIFSATTYSFNLIKKLKVDRQAKKDKRRQEKLAKKKAKEEKKKQGSNNGQATDPS